MRKVLSIYLLVIIILLTLFSNINVSASEEKIKKYGGDGYLVYEGTSDFITINSEYEHEEKQFRGLWVSNFAGDVNSYTTEDAFKKEMNTLLDTMEYYNLNALIFHVRTHNNALYNSSINPKASYWSRVDFNKFDPLKWLIEETHKRGIEFHAWMNPYRVKSSNRTYISGSFPSVNPASNPDNLLSNSSTTILDPGKEVVKSFLVTTCMEFVKRYDVDAIHFDDYFYISDCDDTKTYNENNPNGLNKADWRRENVNEFIRRLSIQLKRHNQENGKYVQLGISPGGTWKNGNGKVTYDENGTAITNGSLGVGNSSYGDYLYADTKLWVDNEWIDYICPQCYHDVQSGLFCELTDWWNSVCKYKKTNLYIGIGFYGPKNVWNDPLELKHELYWLNKLDYVQGFSLYAYSALKSAYKKTNNLKASQMNAIYDDVFKNNTNLPILRRLDFPLIEGVDDIKLTLDNNYKLSFDYNEKVKFYIVYKNEINRYNKLYQGTGNIDKKNNRVEIDINDTDFDKLIIVPTSYNNEYGNSSEINKDDISHKISFIYNNEIIKEIYTNDNKIDIPVFDFDYDNYNVLLSHNLDNIESDLVVYVTLTEKEKYANVTYIEGNNLVTKEFLFTDNFENDVLNNIPKVIGKEIIGLKKNSDNNYEVEYSDIYYKVRFIGLNNEVLTETEIAYNGTISYPTPPSYDGYYFVMWNYNENITCDIDIKAIYNKYNNLIIVDSDNNEVAHYEYREVEKINLKELLDIKDGEKVKFFIGDKECDEIIEISGDVIIKYVINNKKDNGCNANIITINNFMIGISLLLFVIIRKRRLL